MARGDSVGHDQFGRAVAGDRDVLEEADNVLCESVDRLGSASPLSDKRPVEDKIRTPRTRASLHFSSCSIECLLQWQSLFDACLGCRHLHLMVFFGLC